MSKNSIKTSVIIPIYNTEKYLKECIESVITQTQKEIEIILVDDCSTDQSRKIIEEYTKNYSFIKAIYQKVNLKQGTARNVGVKAALGEYIYFLDSDDYISNTLLEECYDMAKRYKLDFVMFDATKFCEGDQIQVQKSAAKEDYDRSDMGIGTRIYNGIEFWKDYYTQGGVYPCACLTYINLDFFKKNKLFFEPEVYYEDLDWMVRLFFCAEKIMYLPQKLHYRRFRTGSTMTTSYNDIHLKSCIILCKKMIRMLLDASNVDEQEMIIPVLRSLLVRFREILTVYSKEIRLESVSPEIIDFYDYIMYLFMEIGKKSKTTQTLIIVAVNAIKKVLGEQFTIANKREFDLEDYTRQVILDELQGFPLNRKDMIVGIYGTGMLCAQFLYLYRNYVDKISAAVFFIDTFKKSGEKYEGFPVYNIKDIKEKKVDSIIVSSIKYKEEMKKNILEYFLDVQILYMPEFVREWL